MFNTLKNGEYAFLNGDMRFNLLYPLIHAEHSAFKSSNGNTICIISKNIMVLWTEAEVYDNYSELMFLIKRFNVTKLFSAVKGLKICRLKKTLVSYCCMEAVKPKISGIMLTASERHAELVAQFIKLFDMEIFEDISGDKDYLHISCGLIKNKCVFLWQDTNITSMCIVLSKNKNFARLNYIYTIQSKRNKGYAKMLVYELSLDLLKNKCTPVLYTDKNNIWSNAVYSKIGYKVLGEIYEYDIISNPIFSN